MKCPAPPPPTDPLDRLFARLREREAGSAFDPGLPGRVEAAVRARLPVEATARVLPRWAVVAAVILFSLGAGAMPRRGAPAQATFAEPRPAPRPIVREAPTERADEEDGP